MYESCRSVSEVIGNDPEMLRFWEQVPDKVRQQLLCSQITVGTLGELQLLCRQLERFKGGLPSLF